MAAVLAVPDAVGGHSRESDDAEPDRQEAEQIAEFVPGRRRPLGELPREIHVLGSDPGILGSMKRTTTSRRRRRRGSDTSFAGRGRRSSRVGRINWGSHSLHSTPKTSTTSSKRINSNVFLGLRDEVVEKVPSEFNRDIPKFGKGQAVVKAPDVEAVEVVGLEYCVTKHGN